ncbi:PH domain-containing protein [Solwaraspora sp. WMMD1047]|uniref:PH domain-containing protein n=1 Tax=Solwaraspora sp. WMMD1047 TaxID=3016102 RepID=UPI0024167B78|nr:PH domain-containing protein [Solwaraspora sp. WMMD1047]MDG4834534.1 PH domain-containing protein [Solwaraspora sp. WMMD1047]
MQNDPLSHRQWRVPAKVPVVKFTAAVLFALVGLLLADGDPVRLVLAGVTSAALVGWGLRDLLLPVRLTADPVGLTVVSGLAGRHRLPWSAVDRIVAHGRGSVRGHQLEIDTGDTVHVLTGSDLGASPDEVAAELRALRADGSTAG